MLPRRSLKLSANPFKFFKQKVLPISVGLIVVLFIYDLFSIRHVNCSLNGGVCPEIISEKLKTYLGDNAIFLNQETLSTSIKSLYPIEETRISFHLFNDLQLELVGNQITYNTKVYLVRDLPSIAMDVAPGSTLSASWPKPTVDIETFTSGKEGLSFDLWGDGTMTPTATQEAKIFYIFTEKPSKEFLIDIYRAIKILSHYLNFSQLYVLDDRIFLRQDNQPDIIVYIPFNEGSLVEALQSFAYLATIKKDAKVIDLRFKNPIIR